MRNQHEDKEALRKGAFSRCKNKKASEVQCSSAMSEQVTWEITVPQWSQPVEGKSVPIHGIVRLNLYQSYITNMKY